MNSFCFFILFFFSKNLKNPDQYVVQLQAILRGHKEAVSFVAWSGDSGVRILEQTIVSVLLNYNNIKKIDFIVVFKWQRYFIVGRAYWRATCCIQTTSHYVCSQQFSFSKHHHYLDERSLRKRVDSSQIIGAVCWADHTAQRFVTAASARNITVVRVDDGHAETIPAPGACSFPHLCFNLCL